MRTPSLLVAASVAAMLLAGCGGGGSAVPADPATAFVNAAAPQTPFDVARAGTDSAMGSISTSEADASAQTGALGAASARREPASAFACRNRTKRTVTANADGSTTVETLRYYDDACTLVESDAVAIFKNTAGTQTIARTITSFDKNHNQLGRKLQNYALTGSTANGMWTVQSSFYPGTSTTAQTSWSHQATVSATSYAGNMAHVVNDAKPSVNASFGHQQATNATIASDASGGETYTGTRVGESYKGAYGSLGITSAPPFTLTGTSAAKQLGATNLSGSIGFDADGNLASINVTGTIGQGNTLTITSSGSGASLQVNGTIANPQGQTIATFVTDNAGNGVLTIVSSGAQVPIVAWHPVWT